MPRLSSFVTALALASIVLSSSAYAETTPSTAVSQLMVLEPGDTSYKLFHGAIWLDADKQSTNYRWGGLQCKGRELSDTSVQLLFAAFRSEYTVAVEWVPSEYKGKQYRCVTGFTISRG
jgi:hypothetical protein